MRPVEIRHARDRARVEISRPATRRIGPRGSRRATASRNRSARLGRSRAERLDPPGGPGGVEHAPACPPPRRARGRPRRRRGRPLAPARRRPRPRASGHAHAHPAARAPAAQLLHRPGVEQPPVGHDGHGVAQAVDQLELVGGEHDRYAGLAPARGARRRARRRRPGRRPENGSSRISSSGSWTRASASCTRCWLPSESFSTASSARSPSPRRLQPARPRPARPPRGPCRAGAPK